MTKFVYGTGNPAKLDHMRKMLAPLNLNFIGVKETDITLPDVDESGDTPLENARIKALAYYKVLKRPVFACDSGLYIDGLPDHEQPGVHVRMVGDRRLTDDEMIAHYSGIAKNLGGKAVARYRNAICLVMSDREIYEHFDEDIASGAFYIVDVPHTRRMDGFPLDSLSVRIDTGEYYYDDTKIDKVDKNSQTNGFQAFFKRVLAQHDIMHHYDALIDENNDPVYDPEPAKIHMNKWDGDEFIEAMQLNPNKSVLEIGVGTGRLAVRVCGKCASFTGIDISPKTIERAKENFREFDNARLICGDFLTHAFEETFDAIYSSLTFMHIKEKDTAIKKAAALLNPGGRFVLSIDKNRQTEIDYGTRKITVFPDTPEEIISLLSGADLTLETHFETEFAYVFVAQKRSALDTMTDEERQAIIYPIILTDYNPDWPRWYAEESVNIEQAIGTSNIARIRHYGSTSIPGMFAKPTVDILLEIPEEADVKSIKERMTAAGYICLDENGLTMETPPPHLMFLGGYLSTGFAERVFHIHVRYYSDNEPDEIVFRDYLIAHPETAKEYADLKRSLWKNFEHNRDGYTAAKGAFIRAVTSKAKEDVKK